MREKDSISLRMLEFGICKSWRSLTVVVCIMPFIHVVIVMGGSTIHHIGVDVGGEWCIYQVFGGFCK